MHIMQDLIFVALAHRSKLVSTIKKILSLRSGTAMANEITKISRYLGVLVFALQVQLAQAQPIIPTETFIPQSQLEDFGSTMGIAPSSPPRPIIKMGIGLIKKFEGWRPNYYDDPVGYCTIGYGHLISLKNCSQTDLGVFSKPLTLARGEEILEMDTRTARASVHRLVKVDLTDQQFSALSSFVFNLGKEKFADSTLLQHVNAENHELASKEFLRWIKSKGQVFQGLRHRRSCESELYLNRLVGSKSGEFSENECKPLPGIASSPVDEIDITKGEVRLPK